MRFRRDELDNLAKQRAALQISQMLPVLQTELDGMMAAVQNKVFAALNAGDLTPQDAYSAWVEVHSAHRLMARLQAQVKLGEAAAYHVEQKENIR